MASVVPCALLVHLTWWRTTTGLSRDLVDALEAQLTDAVTRAWWERVAEVQGVSRLLRDALAVAGDAGARERVLIAAAAATPALTWLVDAQDDGDVVVVREGMSGRSRMFRARPAPGEAPEQASAAQDRRAMAVLASTWLATARRASEPGWVDVPETPDGSERAVAYVDPTGGRVTAAMIGHARFGRLLGEIPVGRTGRSYVLGPGGGIVIAAGSERAPHLAALDPVAGAAGRRIAARIEGARDVSETARLVVDGRSYAIGLSPLWFQGWQLAVVVPEAEFLGAIDGAVGRVAAGLVFFVLVAGLVAVAAVRRLVARPIGEIVDDLAEVERLAFDRLPHRLAHRRSRLVEIDRLSGAIGRMGAGLADFAKYIPIDLVRGLVAEGVRAEPGGTRRELTVLFADLAGFTALSERLGDAVVPVVGAYLDAASRAIAAEGGTVDKFIGDAVMAFWGAPAPDPDHALHACRAALAVVHAVEGLALPDGVAGPLRVRIGIATGPAIVGNVGSATRLNYTALGDAVNLASRLEGVNKLYGTAILIAPATRAAAGVAAREVDTVAVYGRTEAIVLHELLGGDPATAPPAWVGLYEEALAHYRGRRFEAALVGLDCLAGLHPGDGPAARLAARCQRLREAPPPASWNSVTVLDAK